MLAVDLGQVQLEGGGLPAVSWLEPVMARVLKPPEVHSATPAMYWLSCAVTVMVLLTRL